MVISEYIQKGKDNLGARTWVGGGKCVCVEARDGDPMEIKSIGATWKAKFQNRLIPQATP